jgi:aspartate aminotransferase
MKSFSKRIARLGTENAFSVIGRAKKFEQEVLVPQGKNLIYLQIGEPGFNTPENINQAAIRAIKDNQTHYTPTKGIPLLLEAVANYTKNYTGIAYDKNDVVVTPGAKPVMFYTINALIDEGDEVIIPNPAYQIYGSVTEYLGGVVVPIELKKENEFQFKIEDLEEKITARTKLIVINSPQNPTGAVFDKDLIVAIAEVAKKHDLWVLSDEIYSDMIHEGNHFSIASVPGMSERTVILNGCSKTYAMTGYRVGWAVIKNKEMAEAIERLACNDVSCVNAVAQYAAVEAITGPQDQVKKMLAEYKVRRDLLVSLVNDVPGMKTFPPSGAFYLMVDVRELLDKYKINSTELCERIMTEAHVLILPGTIFGLYADDFVRFSYVSTEEMIMEGMKRIKAFVENLS